VDIFKRRCRPSRTRHGPIPETDGECDGLRPATRARVASLRKQTVSHGSRLYRQQHAKFRFGLRYRAITGLDKAELPEQIRTGFPALPAGCHIELDRQSAEWVLQNLREQISVRTDRMVEELRDGARSNPEITVGEFLQRAE